MQQYQGYKVPLLSLSSGFANKLSQAGSRIYATPEQAKSLTSLSKLVVVGEDSSTVDESRAVKDQDAVRNLLNNLDSVDARKPVSDSEDVKVDEEGAEIVKEEEAESFPTKVAMEKKERQRAAVLELGGKFVSLADLLPPLPQKGLFEVSKIIDSTYFFS